MSTQQDIYAAGSENHPPMINKDNYVPWSSRIIRHVRSGPNRKMIVDSIKNGPYVRRMIATPGEPDLPVPEKKAKLFNEWEKFTSTDGESIESYYHHFMQLMNDLKRNKNFPEIIAANLKFLNNLQPEWKRYVTKVGQIKNLHEADFTQIYNFLKMNQDERRRQIAQPGMNMSQDRQIQNVRGNGRNQFGQYAGQVVQNQQGYNAWQNGWIQVTQNAVQKAGVQNGGNQNGIVVVPGIANQNGTGNVVAARAEGDLDEIEEVNANRILMANLQHASTSGTQLDKAPVYDTDGSAEVQLNVNCYDNQIFNMFTQEEQYTDLLEPIPKPQLVPQNDNHVTSVAPSMVQSGGTVETSSAPNEETGAHQETVYRNLVDQVAQVKRLQAQLRDLKGKSSDTPSASNTLDPLNQKLELKIVELEFQVVNYKREISHIKTTYKNLFDSITSNQAHAKLHNLIYENFKLRARLFKNTSESMNNTSGTSVTPHVDKPKIIDVTHHSKKLHALIPSHSVPQPIEFNVVKHRNVITSVMFKIDPSQTSRVDLVPNNQSSVSIKTNPITNFQHHVTFKENMSSNTVNASFTGLVHIARTRRPQPKGNSRNARVPSASKSSEVKKNITVKHHCWTLLLSKNQKTMSSECNNIKLAIRNNNSKIICGTCKKCLVTANHDACLLSPVNALNSRANNMCANASPSANQKRHRTQEVILNGDSPAPTRVIKGVVQPVQRLERKNKLKDHGTLLMDLPNKYQLKFNIHKDAKTLMEAIEKRFGRNKETKKRNKTDLEKQSLDDWFNSLKIYKAEVKRSSYASTTTQNIAFVSSQNTDNTNEPVSVVASVSAASAKNHVSALLNVDTLSNAQIDVDDLEEIDLKWQMAMLTMRARQFLQRTGRNLGANRPTLMGFDMSKAEEEPTNYALMAFTSLSSSSSDNEIDVISYKTGLESVEARLLVYQQNETIFEEDIKLIKLDIQLRDNALVVLRQKFEKAKIERDDLKLKLEKFQTSSKNLNQLLASQTNNKTRLGYDTQVFTSSMSDCNEMFSSETDESLPTSPIYDRPSSPIIEDWVSDSEDDSEAEPSQNTPSFVYNTEQVKTPRYGLCLNIQKSPKTRTISSQD
nr:hypothetical protein [Tanacetum cinerariifolium]